MPHNLTETAAWTPNVSVPNAGDDGAARHALGEAAWQALTNRSLYTKGVAEAALPKAGGTVNGNLTVNGNVSMPGGTRNLSVGGNVTTGGDLTVGDDLTVTDSFTMNGNAFSVPNASITLGSGSLHVTSGGVDAGADIATTGGDITLPGTKRVKYTGSAADRTRNRRIRMAAGTSPQPVSAVSFSGGHWIVFNTAYLISVPLPSFATATVITAVWLRYEATGANGTVELVRHNIGDWGVSPGGATPAVSVLGSATLTTTGSGVKTAFFALGTPEAISNSLSDYWIRITGAASSTHDIHGAQLTVQLVSPGSD